MFYRDTWVEIDLDRIYHNVSHIKAFSGFEHLFAVVKANAYGHGDVEVARVALEAGASHLAVAFLDEALALRKQFPQTKILVMGPIRPTDLQHAAEQQITVTAHDLAWIEAISDYRGPRANIHLKLDTGMNRIGLIGPEQLDQALKQLRQHPAVNLCGLFTHFATADCIDDYYKQQSRAFDALVEGIDLSQFEIVHQSNSAAMLRHGKQQHSNGGRLGIAMYGLPPSDDLELPFELQQAFSLHARITQLKTIQSGTKVGYAASYEAPREERIATLPLGYADGWLRYHQGRKVEIDGRRFPIVGRVCMDQCMIRVDDEVQLGDQVTLLGDLITVTDAADDLNTINYEIVCSISDRVPRLYKRGGQTVGERYDRYDGRTD
ncbi:alanine racemase [Motiliproteus coralliicola]|uniref:Alanine racemase n=1 Tax=Motiliproteus coralliicola TaxID=2283196 RepID=A0A369WPR4_9GAMM|nr:alanine racemase [Motiliproteus coralliicola]RDE22556.1 alanine racemase [Motiliproteus coralliicola]